MKEEGKRRGSSPGGGAGCKWRGGRWGRRERSEGTAKNQPGEKERAKASESTPADVAKQI